MLFPEKYLSKYNFCSENKAIGTGVSTSIGDEMNTVLSIKEPSLRTLRRCGNGFSDQLCTVAVAQTKHRAEVVLVLLFRTSLSADVTGSERNA